MTDRMNNVRVYQQEDKRWTLAWEDENGVTQERKDYPNPVEAQKDRDDLLSFLKQGEPANG